MQSSFQKHFQLIVFRKLLGWKLEKSYTKKYTCHFEPPSKISFKHEWNSDLVSEHAQRPEVEQFSRSFQWNQPILKPIREKTERPVVKDYIEHRAS